MKKFLLSVLLCAGIFGAASPMKRNALDELVLHSFQTTELLTLSAEILEKIACYLEGESFSSLAQVCSRLREICDTTPTRYLLFTFSDAAGHGSFKLIDRFIAECHEWMFEPGVGEEVFTSQENQENDQTNTIKIFKQSFGRGLQDFLGKCLIFCISQNNEISRFVFYWESDEQIQNIPQTACMIYLNVKENNNAINGALAQYLRHANINIPLNRSFDLNRGSGRCICGTTLRQAIFPPLWIAVTLDQSKGFTISSPSNSTEDLLNAFGLIALYIMAIQKNNLHVAYTILDNESAFDCLPSDILDEGFCNFLGAGYEITDIVDAIRFERKRAAALNSTK